MKIHLHIRSSVFDDGRPIPRHFTADGEDMSPPLSWDEPPGRTQSLALICDDPDAPTPEPWVHWLICNLPPGLRELPEGLPASTELRQPPGASQGRNSFMRVGYGGPAPPRGHGVHHYHFRLYALDTTLTLMPAFAKEDLLRAMEGHVLGAGELVGTYQR